MKVINCCIFFNSLGQNTNKSYPLPLVAMCVFKTIGSLSLISSSLVEDIGLFVLPSWYALLILWMIGFSCVS